MDTMHEPARSVPVLASVDVVVCGAGPAGCAAALAAARAGAEVLLVEKDGHLGGQTVAGLVCVILSTNAVDFVGIWHEWARALRQLGGIGEISDTPGQHRGSVDPELVKFAWDRLLSAAGVRLLHHVQACTAALADGRVSGVFVTGRMGRRAIRAKRVIDCTGDAVVAASAGAPWDQGDGVKPWAMALTKVFRMAGVRFPEGFPRPGDMETIAARLDAAIARGEFSTPTVLERQRLLTYIRGRLWQLPEPRAEILSVISRVLRVDPLDPFDVTRAEREGREQALEASQVYRRFVPGCERAYLLDTSAHIGLRSSRRIRGLATTTAEDALGFRRYPDGIAPSSWDIDVWPADSYDRPAVDRGSPSHAAWIARAKAGEFFSVRYGALVPQGVDGLLVAGRCCSAEHLAQSSARIQQTCMAMGEAAGLAAAMGIAAGVQPRGLDPAPLVARLAELRAATEPAFTWMRGRQAAPG